MPMVKNCSRVIVALCAVVLLLGKAAKADKLYHTDGTVIEGKIQAETADKIVIETKYGQLNYDRADLLRVERAPTAVTVTTGTAAAAPINLMKYIPQGPVNPFAPPQIPILVTLAPRATGAPVQTTSTPFTPTAK